MTDFQDAVFEFVKSIPEGSVMTYKQVAQAIGRPRSYRAVGNALNKNRSPLVPCHRVIRSDGNTGGYFWGSEKKLKKLIEEGAVKPLQ